MPRADPRPLVPADRRCSFGHGTLLPTSASVYTRSYDSGCNNTVSICSQCHWCQPAGPNPWPELMAEACWRIDELAQKAGLTVDTIRYYAREGLLRPPVKQGRHRLYGSDHLERLDRIRELQAQRFSLAAIRAIVDVDRPGLEGLFSTAGRELHPRRADRTLRRRRRAGRGPARRRAPPRPVRVRRRVLRRHRSRACCARSASSSRSA